MLTTKATIAASRITGSANMKTGIVPEVRVTTLIHILFFMFEGCTDICPHLSKGFPVVLEGRVYIRMVGFKEYIISLTYILTRTLFSKGHKTTQSEKKNQYKCMLDKIPLAYYPTTNPKSRSQYI